jgi:transposase-like protein
MGGDSKMEEKSKKRTYSHEFKANVIKEYMAGKGSYKSISEKYGMPLKTVSNLIARYKKTGIVEKPRHKVRSEEETYKEKYEILKNFQAFLKEQQGKK